MPRSSNPFIRFITNLLIDNALSKSSDKIGDVIEVNDQVISGHNRNSQGHKVKKHTLADSLSGKYAEEARKDIKGGVVVLGLKNTRKQGVKMVILTR